MQKRTNLSIDPKNISILLDAISYSSWNNRQLSSDDKNYIDELYKTLESFES